MVKIEKIADEIIKISGDTTLKEIYAEIKDYELLVEPLSNKKKISQFLFEGGLGYNSLKEGTFSSHVFWIKAKSRDGTFQYGKDLMPLYNVGYPLHRIVEGSPHKIYPQKFEILDLVIPIQKREKKEVQFFESEIPEKFIPKDATNVFFINDFGARLIGLPKKGFVSIFPEGMGKKGSQTLPEFLENRFIEDKIPSEHSLLKAFSMPSKVKGIYEAFREKLDGLFFALFTNIGVLIIMSGDESKLNQVWSEISEISRCIRLV
ncbi:MAG: hypothetical protein QME40_06225 [bacterium]|nr:hypothetical protein [bacterium]